ncbi:MAG: prolyl oligopeptidase family serine peptidase, partial [bacterium]
SAGWASFQLYTPFFLRSDDMFFDSECRRIFEACMSPDRTERLLGNLRNTPVLAVHGGNDDNVPPTHARLLTGILDRMDYDVDYWEEPEQGHWWDSNPDLPGAHCVDAPRIRSFMREHKRNPKPRHVTLVTYDLGNTNSKYWVSVNEEIDPLGGVYVDAETIEYGFISCKTMNVRELEFNLRPDAFPQNVSEIKVEIDNQNLSCPLDENGKAIFTNLDGVWQAGKIESKGIYNLHKTPQFRGPIKRAYFKPFIFVVGASGTDDENALNLEAAVNLQIRWWYRANGYSTIITDKDYEQQTGALPYNLILIGGPSSNSLSAKMAENLPIKIGSGGVALGDKFIPGTDLAVKFVYPNPDSEGTLIYADWGTSLKGMRLAVGLTCLYSGSGVPDFLVYDDEVRLGGYASVRAAGFFDNDWQLDSEYYFINHFR